MNFNLSHMSISSILMITNYSHLDHESADGAIVHIFQRYFYPADWFFQVDNFYLL